MRSPNPVPFSPDVPGREVEAFKLNNFLIKSDGIPIPESLAVDTLISTQE